jgi:hypothetical protein
MKKRTKSMGGRVTDAAALPALCARRSKADGGTQLNATRPIAG